MEAEVVRMSCSLFNGGPESCGTVSSFSWIIMNDMTLLIVPSCPGGTLFLLVMFTASAIKGQ